MTVRADLAAWALLLIAMAIAYFVCLKASKETSKVFQYGGYAIGVIILVVSLVLAIADVSSRISRRRRVSPSRTMTRPTTVPRMPQLPAPTTQTPQQK